MTPQPDDTHTPWYWLPATGLWRLATAIETRLGIIRSFLLGAALAVLGLIFCMTFVGILVGIPTLAVGVALFLRALI